MSRSNPEPRELTFTGRFNIEAAAASDAGQAPRNRRFSMVAYTGGPMRIAGFSYPVVVDLAGLDLSRASWPVFVGHHQDIDDLLGQTDRVDVVGSNLVASGAVIAASERTRRVVEAHDRGFHWQASIGAAVRQREFIPEGRTVNVNGTAVGGPVIVARQAELGEISFVFIGADRNTSATIAAASAAKESNIMEESTNDKNTVAVTDGKETGAQATGTEATTVDAQAPAGTDAGTPAIHASASGAAFTADPVADMRARAAAEQLRITAVRKVCGDMHADIAAKAIAQGWDVTRTELEVLRADRPKPPAAHIPDSSMTATMLEAACMLAGGVRGNDVAAAYGEQASEAADKRFKGGIGLQELLLEAAWANGYDGRSFRDSRSVLRFAFGGNLQAALSTINIGGILSNVANKFLLEGFFSVERVWRSICAVRNVSDFKTITSYRLIGRDQYEVVAPGGELKHGTLGEESYTNKADTYGLMLAVDRRDIINDDLGAITTVPRKLGRGSGLKINDIFWSTFLNNATFFAAGNNNYLTGTDTVLSIDGLSKAEKAFMDQVDGDGKPLGAMPAIMLVPTALSAMATMLYKSLEIRDTTASTKYPVANPHQNKFRAEVSRYLSNTSYTGYSEKAWYLLADPADLPVIEVAFLNGQESPTIETAEADFNVLGVQMRGYHDFGVALQDPKGGCKAKGEA